MSEHFFQEKATRRFQSLISFANIVSTVERFEEKNTKISHDNFIENVIPTT